tara:strand:- start:1044 stop:1832 length:789 start_codon:yes stop_codon:yes gene_type:complete
MSEKNPKKVLSPEQLLKMQEGRKKAAESRKLAKEKAKEDAKNKEKALAKSDKSDLLELEIQALAQQQDRINNLKLQVDRKKQVKSKLKKIKDEKEEVAEAEEIAEAKANVNSNSDSDSEQSEEEIEIKKPLEKIDIPIEIPKIPKKEIPINESEKHNIDKDYKELFELESSKLRVKLDPSVHKYYDNAIKKFDYNIPLNDNINNMINYVKLVVQENTQLANKIKEEKQISDDSKIIVERQEEETIVEKQITSQISKLMKMRY